MELKLNQPVVTRQDPSLLIVPYGIETRRYDSEDCFHILLIVPYGIETRENQS